MSSSLINKIKFSNLSLTFQIFLINLIVIVISFIFFGLFNFYIISRDFSLDDKKNKLNDISKDLVQYLVNNAIKKSLYTVESKKNLARELNPNTSRVIQKVELISSEREDLDPYTLQSILDTYYQNINYNIKIYNTKTFILFDSENYNYSNNLTIKTLNMENLIKENFFDRYKSYYINNFIYLWRLYNKKKYQQILVTEFNELPKTVQVIKNHKPLNFFYLDDDKSIIIKLMNPILKGGEVFGVAIITGSLREIDQKIAELSFSLFNNLIILILIVILISIFYARSIVKPIKKLSDITYQYILNASANLSNQSFPKRGDEIGKLSQNSEVMSKELLDKINELERFAADVSHELKNPLASIRSANEILQKDDKSKEIRDKLISIIDKDTSKMNRLISDILNYTRTKSEIDRLNNEKVDIKKLLIDIINNYSENKKNINFKTDFSDGEYTTFLNYEKIAQVISILFDNAISFSTKNSSIGIFCKHLNNNLIIYIVDQGPGINFEYNEKIFKRFYTDRGKDSDMHSGLGLDIARHIVKSYGGKIYLENKKIKGYQGACFVIELPLKSI